MKNIFLAAIITAAFACNSDTGTGDREYNQGTQNEKIDNTPATETGLGDTTSTSNNNMYNTDSAAGKGGVYDTAAQSGVKNDKR